MSGTTTAKSTREARALAAYDAATAAEVAAREAYAALEDAQARELYCSGAERVAAMQARRDASEAVYTAARAVVAARGRWESAYTVTT